MHVCMSHVHVQVHVCMSRAHEHLWEVGDAAGEVRDAVVVGGAVLAGRRVAHSAVGRRRPPGEDGVGLLHVRLRLRLRPRVRVRARPRARVRLRVRIRVRVRACCT